MKPISISNFIHFCINKSGNLNSRLLNTTLLWCRVYTFFYLKFGYKQLSYILASELSLYMFQEIAASKDLNVSIIIRQVRDYTSYQAALGQLNIATLSREEFDKIEYERDKFLWHKSENKCIPNAMNFLRGKLNLPSSMEFIDVQTEYRFDALVPSCLDVFICSNQAQSFRERVVVGVEFFKTGTKIAKSESGQFLVELASIASHSEYPCLLLLTDLVDSYTIAYFSKPPCDNTQLYILYELRSTAAFDLIRKWLAMDSSNTSQYQDARASLKDHFFNETPAELIEQQRSNHYNLMSGYISQKIEKAFLQTGKQLISKGRSGGVFAVDVDNKQLALKICNFINTTVVEEMMNETRIYELLVKANYKYAPKLESYGTFQSKKYFGIAIQRVRGRAINNREEKVVKEECMKAIKALHELKICHNDVRPPNILVTESGQISVIDFGLSFRTHSLNYFNIDITRQ